MGLFHRVFSLVDSMNMNQDHPKMIRLPRTTADELVLASILIPLACSELNAEFSPEVFCSDASNQKGAFCEAVIPEQVAEVLWKTCLLYTSPSPRDA